MFISNLRWGLVVRLLTVFFLCSFIQAMANQAGKQKVTVVANDVSLGTVFEQIEKQTGLRFMYAVDAVNVNEKVTVFFKKTMLDEVLGALLKKKGVVWQYRDGTISLKTKIAITEVFPVMSDPPITVVGRVLDAKGNPVPGATIMVKGAKKGAKTNADGEFVLGAVESNAVLIVRSMGFETIEVVVNSRNILIKLNEVIGTLRETVVKGGYYDVSQYLSTGNITKITADKISMQPVSDPLLALQGRVPGMIVSQTTGLQGGVVNVQIRGKNSILNGTQPLFIVDGVPYDNSISAPPVGNFGALGTTVSALSFVNPADIESVDVLKDADATSIYGSRGANGVILITTKKGRTGQARVNCNFNYGWQDVKQRMKLMNTPQYLAMRREAFKNDNVDPTEQNAPDLLVWDTTRYTDWQDKLIGHTAKYLDGQASVSGGTAGVQYLLGGNYHRETTIYPGDFSTQRGGAHFNIIGSSIEQRFKASLTGNYVISKTNFPGIDLANNTLLPPNAPPVYNSDGSLNWAGSTWQNPFAQLISNVLDAQTTNIITNLDISYRLIDNFVIKNNIGYNDLRLNTFSGNTIRGVDPIIQNAAKAAAQYNSSRNRSWIMEPQVSYSTVLEENMLNFILGATLMGNQRESQYVLVSGIPQDELIRNPNSGTSYYVNGNGGSYKYMALFGRVGYSYKDKYLINGTLRRDGSSRFGPRKKFATFGSLGIGWIFSQEGIFKAAFPFLSFGKIRGSYGITGNDQIGDYQYLDQYRFVEQTYQGIKGLRSVGLFNPDFAWERTRKAEVGLETGFLKDRIFFTASFYKTISNNQLIAYQLPVITGGTSIIGNVPAIIQNTGWEIMLTTQNILNKEFEWKSSFNISIPKNKLVSNGGGFISVSEGHSLSDRDLFKVVNVDPVDGAFRFLNDQNEPVIGDLAFGKASSIDLAPIFFGGFSNEFKYKGFQLDVFLQFVKQNGARGVFSLNAVPGTMNNQPVEALGRWTAKGDIAKLQRYNQNYLLALDYQNWISSNANYGDASFIRCKNISLSWRMGEKLREKIHVKGLVVYLRGQNVFTVTKYKGWDPETQSVLSIPPLRTGVLGISLDL